MSEQIQKQLFDYEALDTESRIVIQQRAGEIKTLAKRVAGDIVEIGGKLAEVKDRLGGNGRFNGWLSAELGWSERTAYNFIAVHERFGSANFAIENVAPSALYLLVAPGTPEPARQAAVEMANQGEKVTHKTAKVLVETARGAEPKTAEMFEAPEAEEDFEDEQSVTDLDESAEMGQATEEPLDKPDAVLTPDKPTSKAEAPVKPSKSAEPAPVAAKPLSVTRWSKEQIVIGITLMPQDGDSRGRQAIVSIRTAEGSPTIQSKRLPDAPGQWPQPIDEMIEAFAFKLESEGKPKPAKKPVAKSANNKKAGKK
jgi:hypothetical protein